jgi:hypothetical protein
MVRWRGRNGCCFAGAAASWCVVTDVLAVVVGLVIVLVVLSPVILGIYKGRKAQMVSVVSGEVWRVAFICGAVASAVLVVGVLLAG